MELEVENIGVLRNTLAPKVGVDPNYPYLPNSPTATPERGTASDYRYERTR